jgi:hypothetical protein
MPIFMSIYHTLNVTYWCVSEGFFFLFKNFQGSLPNDFETIEGTIMKLFLMSLGEYKVSLSSWIVNIVITSEPIFASNLVYQFSSKRLEAQSAAVDFQRFSSILEGFLFV